MPMNNKRLGDYIEHKVITWAWENQYEAFPNAGCTGDIDIILLKDNEILKFDVKVATYMPHGVSTTSNWGTHAITHNQIKNGIKRLIYFPGPEVINWDPKVCPYRSTLIPINNLKKHLSESDYNKISKWENQQ